MWGTSEIIAVTSVASLRRCPTSPESVPHFSGIRITITVRGFVKLLGAVYMPVLDKVPTAGESDHSTDVVTEPATVALNAMLLPAVTVAFAGERETCTGL